MLGSSQSKGAAMDIVQNQTVRGAVVVLDGKYFISCRFEECNILHCGGDYGWVSTEWINCHLSVDGPAARTFNLLKIFGMLKQETADPLAQPPSSSKLENH
jgi:hypothetical protein